MRTSLHLLRTELPFLLTPITLLNTSIIDSIVVVAVKVAYYLC